MLVYVLMAEHGDGTTDVLADALRFKREMSSVWLLSCA